MSRKIVAIALICIISFMSMSLIGCDKTTNFLGGASDQEKNFTHSSEVSIPIEKLRTLHPIITKDEDAYYINKLIYEGLFEYDQNLTLTNVLAESYSYSADGGTVSIQLKKGILWHDGEELTARDVKFTMDVISGTSASNSTFYNVNLRNVQSVNLDSDDPYRLIVSFKENRNNSMTSFTFPIIPMHRFKNIDDAKKVKAGFIPIGTGRYHVTDYNEISHITLNGYQDYHKGNSPSNTLKFIVVPEKEQAVNLMDINSISLTFSKEIERETIYTNKDVNVVNFPSNEAEIIGYNINAPALKDKRVRQAIAYAINTKQIVESSYYKNGIQNESIYYPNFLGVNSSNITYSYNIDKAKDLLEKAGYLDRDGDGLAEDVNDQTITINILVNSENHSRVAAAQIIKENLDQLAIKSYITSRDWDGYNTDLARGNFDIYVGGYQFRENYDLRPLLHTDYNNLIGYSNIVLDNLLNKMESDLSQEERKSTYVQIQEILTDELPYYCLLYKTYGAIASPALKGDILPSFLNLFSGAEKWHLVMEIEEPEEDKDGS
ncbi:MAG: peptide ABC transporter substrate-binding protein [Eubacteriales bacterium]|nr:peptide ABC transporter substrate-binding protein [Eubacteriales bacterium]